MTATATRTLLMTPRQIARRAKRAAARLARGDAPKAVAEAESIVTSARAANDARAKAVKASRKAGPVIVKVKTNACKTYNHKRCVLHAATCACRCHTV